MNSPGHKAIVLSTTLNYVGVGLAIDASTGKKLWTAVYIKGPDRTGARSTTSKPTVAPGATGATKRVTVGWTGADVRLQVLTSGFNYWQVQRRTDGGAWTTVYRDHDEAVDDARARRRPHLRVPDGGPGQGRQLGRLVDGPDDTAATARGGLDRALTARPSGLRPERAPSTARLAPAVPA